MDESLTADQFFGFSLPCIQNILNCEQTELNSDLNIHVKMQKNPDFFFFLLLILDFTLNFHQLSFFLPFKYEVDWTSINQMFVRLIPLSGVY